MLISQIFSNVIRESIDKGLSHQDQKRKNESIVVMLTPFFDDEI